MATRTINSTFKLRGDTLANWNEKNPVLAEREVGIVFIPANAGSGLNEPATLMKVGDGATAFKSLPYVSALAGDVAEWAKAATKPSYSANEINGLTEAIQNTETNTQYKIEQDAEDGHKLNLFYKGKDDAQWTANGSITIPDNDTGATEVELKSGDTGNAITGMTYDAATRKITYRMEKTFAEVGNASTDTKDSKTIEGTRKYAEDLSQNAASELIGEATDTKDADTIYGAKAFATDAVNTAKSDLKGTYASAQAGDETIAGAKKYADGKASDLLGTDADEAGADTIKGANKAAAAALAEAQAKVASLTAADNTMDVGGTATAPTIRLKVDPAQNNAIQVGENGVKVVIPDAAVINVVKKATANTGYIASYQVTVDGTPVGVDIDIPKDYLVKDADIKVVTVDDEPYEGAKVGDKYIDFTVNTVEGSGNESHIYLPVNDLAHVYTAGFGIEISAADVVSIKIDSANANGLAADAAGLKLNTVVASTNGVGGSNGAMLATDKERLDGMSNGANKVEASETNGNVKIDGVETKVYELPATVLDANDTYIFDGGNA